MLSEERFERIWRWCARNQQMELLLQDLRKWGFAGDESLTRGVWTRPLNRLAIQAKLLMLSHLEATYGVPACNERRFLTWDEVKIMRRSNIGFGSNTMRHSSLTAEQGPSLEEELVQSREMVESKLKEDVSFLAYPNGAYNGHVIDAARKAGYTHCFTNRRGLFRRGANNHAIPRICVNDSVLVNGVPPLSPSRARFHLQNFVAVALAFAAFILRHLT